jgi:hypothetical protein
MYSFANEFKTEKENITAYLWNAMDEIASGLKHDKNQ